MISIILSPFGIHVKINNRMYHRPSNSSIRRLMQAIHNLDSTIKVIGIGDCKAYRITYMTDNTHTPGPCKIVSFSKNGGKTVYPGVITDTEHICYVAFTTTNNEVANARLIAAAYNSYDKHCSTRAMKCAEADLLGELLAERDQLRLINAEMLAALERACYLIDDGYLQDPDWESMDFEQKMQSKQTLFYDAARAAIEKARKGSAHQEVRP